MIVTLTGQNHYLLQTELDRQIKAFIAEHTNLAVEKLDGEEADFDQIIEAIQSVPFLTNKKLVVLKKPGSNKQFMEQITSLASSSSGQTTIIIVEPKLDKRSSYYKYLKSQTDYHEFNELDSSALGRWLVAEAKAQQASLQLGDAQFLVERVGASQQLLSSELSKLISYNAQITRQSIELLIEKTPHSTIFELLDAAFTSNIPLATRLYSEQRRMRVEPQQILAMIIWQLHVLAIVKSAGNLSADEIAKQSKTSAFVIRKTQNMAKGISLSTLKMRIHEVLTLDTTLKSQSIDVDEALLELLMRLGQ
ncbi:MAG: DNA polymerase III subunit delta [Candidatus Saccharimonadales bacterium]